jgi:uncharacterized Zn finger protein (UPF0148 family)
MKKILYLFLIVSFIFVASNDAYPRAGGGGGKKSSSSSRSSTRIRSFSSGSSKGVGVFPLWAIFTFGGLGLVIYIIYRMNKSKIDAKLNEATAGLAGNFTGTEAHNHSIINEGTLSSDFLIANPDFNLETFKGKVQIAFPAIQDAWMNQNLSKVRKWISDGVYQRFHVQFEMMKKLGQKNEVSNIKIDAIKLVSGNLQNDFSVITVAVYFTMDDKFISEKIKELNEEFYGEKAMEYWTFVKKSGVTKGDLYSSGNCPNCGDLLNEDGGEVSKCKSCGTVTYLGDYDWVLSEITQEEDYNEGFYANEAVVLEVLKPVGQSIQSMEDKTSNAFVHYLLSLSSTDNKFFSRFATEELLSTLKQQNETPFVYNRVYINTVDYMNYYADDKFNHIMVSVKYSAQRVRLNENKVDYIDDDVNSHFVTLTLSKKLGGDLSKAKLWSHDCPGCGAPFADSTALKCSYCGEKINSTDKEWIVSAIS